MTPGELFEHRAYLADERKLAAYRAALTEVVHEGDLVLDLGAGTGILGYLACQAGAGRVVAVDRGDIIDVAKRIAADNGLAGRIEHVQALSTELILDERVDVVVCDQIGGLVHDAGILSCFADARRRLLADGGRLVPEAFRVFVAPVSFPIGREAVDFWGSHPASIDAGAAREIAANTEWKYNIVVDDVVALSESQELARFGADSEAPISGALRFAVTAPGRFDGYLGWFEARMSPSVTLTNDPWAADRFDRWCNFYALDASIEVAERDEVSVEFDVRPKGGVVSWTTEVRRGGELRLTNRQSTFLAATKSDLLGRIEPVRPSNKAGTIRTVLDLLDGSRSVADVIAALGDHTAVGFASPSHLEAFVRKVVNLAT